jgi:predicted O-methyltransferase YrrM
MNPVQIGRQRFSNIFWGIVDEKVDEYPYEILEKIVKDQQELRELADYNTGSLPYDDAVELYKLVRFFQPLVIAEVGTFIGVSTKAIRQAALDGEFSYVIHTCDFSNNLTIDASDNRIVQYPKKSSTDMFKEMAEIVLGVDFMYLDGRLQQSDLELFHKIVHDQTVFVFDDFEGIEKGVVNAMMVESPGRVLIYPREGRKTAVSLPLTLLQFVPQEAV